MKSKREGRRPQVGLELPFGNLIRGITRSRTPVEREEAAAAYLLALAAQRHAERSEDRLAVAAMASRTRRELLGHAAPESRGPLLDALASALVAGLSQACADAMLGLVAWYEERARFAEGQEVAEVADLVATSVRDGDCALRAAEVRGRLALRCGRWRSALEAYRRMGGEARARGLRTAEWRAALGVAGVDLARGHLSRARARATRVLADASASGDSGVVALGHHVLFAIERRRRNVRRALESAREALRAFTDSPERGSLLVECAHLCADLGERALARRTFEAALGSSLEMRTRLAAEVGLLELAIGEDNEFELRARCSALESDAELAEVPLWHTRFWAVVARGLRRFGREPAAEQALEKAAWVAEWNGLGASWMDADGHADGESVSRESREPDEETARTMERFAAGLGGAERA